MLTKSSKYAFMLLFKDLGEFTRSYILHTRAFGTYLLRGVIYLAKKLECDGILYVKNLKILYMMVFYM